MWQIEIKHSKNLQIKNLTTNYSPFLTAKQILIRGGIGKWK